MYLKPMTRTYFSLCVIVKCISIILEILIIILHIRYVSNFYYQ